MCSQSRLTREWHTEEDGVLFKKVHNNLAKFVIGFREKKA